MITSKQILKRLNESLSTDSEIDKKSNVIDADLAKKVGDWIGVDWDKTNFNQFHRGMIVELEHGDVNPKTDVIPKPDSDVQSLTIIGKIALAHLNEIPDYYVRLDKMEKDAGVED